jgi:hypothetical protein
MLRFTLNSLRLTVFVAGDDTSLVMVAGSEIELPRTACGGADVLLAEP